MATDLEQLTASFDANITKWEKQMTKMGVAFDKQQSQIIKNQSDLTRRLNAGWGKLNFSGITKAFAGGAAIVGIERFVSSIVKAASDIKDTSDALKVGSDELQEWGTLAARNGTDQDTFNTALDKFGKNLGEAALKGSALGKELSSLGISTKGTVTDAFYQLADAVAKTKDPQQQVAIVTDLLGKNAAKLTPILAQGSAALKAQGDQLKKNGVIMTSDAIDKIDELGDSWGDLKRQLQSIGGNILAGFLDEFHTFASDVTSPAFQSSMQRFGQAMADVAKVVLQIAPHIPQLIELYATVKGAAIGGRIAGTPGAIVGGLIGAAGSSSVLSGDDSKTVMGAAPGDGSTLHHSTPGAGTIDRSGSLDAEAQAKAKAEAKERLQIEDMLADAAQKRADEERSADLEVSDSRREAIKAQDDALLQQTEGTKDYYAVSREIIEELSKLDIESSKERADADIASVNERTKAAERELDKRRQIEIETYGHAIITDQQYQDERAAIEKSGADQVTAINQTQADRTTAIHTKQNSDLAALDEEQQQNKARAIELTNTVRGGLEDIGVAALHGFGSAKQALAGFLDQLAQAILKMYVLKPLLDSLLGDQGTSGGGILGSFFGGLGGGSTDLVNVTPSVYGGYASGTRSSNAGWHWVGENGPELMKLPGGAQVIPSGASLALARTPATKTNSAAITNVFSPTIDARGAVEGTADLIDKKLRAAVGPFLQAAGEQTKRAFPTLMDQNMRDRY